MIKPESLRERLEACITDFDRNPENLLVFVDAGDVRSTSAHGLSFEYSYKLNVLILEFAGDINAIMVALLVWLRSHQPELLANHDTAREAIQFEADVLDNQKVDLSITVPLTERVIVKQQSDQEYLVEHAPEPQLTDHEPQGAWSLFDAQGSVIAEWDSGAPLGSDLETPHPSPTRFTSDA